MRGSGEGEGGAVRFAILAEGRSGSNWLVDLLNSHPACNCLGEVFLNHPKWPPIIGDPLVHLEQQLQAAAEQPGKTHVGFKHLPSFDAVVARHVARDPRFRVILLTRRSRLAQYASRKIALLTNQWKATPDEPEPDGQPRVDFVVREFLDFCRGAEGWFRQEQRMLRARRGACLRLTYEELEAGRALPRLLAFLDLPPVEGLGSSHRRLNERRAHDRFTNPGRARCFAALIAWHPTRKLLRIARGIRPLRSLLE